MTRKFATTPEGRLFRGARGGPLSESVCPAAYDLRDAALSLWLNASGAPAEIAARAGTSVQVLERVYTPLHHRPPIHHQPANRTCPRHQS